MNKNCKMSTKFKIKSPSRKVFYTIKDCFEKFEKRRTFKVEIGEPVLVCKYQWNKLDGDFLVPLKLSTVPSLWTNNSADFEIELFVPIHRTGAGHVHFGHASEEDIEQAIDPWVEKNPPERKIKFTCRLGDEVDEIIVSEDEIDEEVNCKLFHNLVPEAFLLYAFRTTLRGFNKKHDIRREVE